MTTPGSGTTAGGPWRALGPGEVAVGVDVGGTKTLGVALSVDGLVGTAQLPTRRGADGVVATVRAVVEELQAGLVDGEVTTLGIGIPGTVDADAGVVSHAVNLELEKVALAASLEALLRVRAAVENDANVAALGAFTALGSRGSLALLNLGTGLAVGVVLNESIYRGAFGGAGEIGHLAIDPAGDVCACGQRGCLELQVSGTAFRRIVEGSGASSAEELLVSTEPLPAATQAAVDLFFDRLAWTVHVVALSLDVERIVLAGGITSLRPGLEDNLAAALRRRAATSPFINSLELAARVTTLAPDFPAGAIGAAVHGLMVRTNNVRVLQT